MCNCKQYTKGKFSPRGEIRRFKNLVGKSLHIVCKKNNSVHLAPNLFLTKCILNTYPTPLSQGHK